MKKTGPGCGRIGAEAGRSQLLPVDGRGDAHAGETAAKLLVGFALAVQDVGQVVRVAADQPRHICYSAATQVGRHLNRWLLLRLPRHLSLASVRILC